MVMCDGSLGQEPCLLWREMEIGRRGEGGWMTCQCVCTGSRSRQPQHLRGKEWGKLEGKEGEREERGAR